MLILKENAANSVPTPPVGKDTFFIDDSGTPSVKNAAGTVTTFPTTSASNAQVLFMNGTAITGDAQLTYNYNTDVLTVTGNVAATRVLTDNLLYANGTAWDLQQPAGSNTQIQYNNNSDFGASANFTFNSSTNVLTVTGNISTGNVSATGLVSGATVAGSLTTAAQPNITSVGTLTSLAVTGNITSGNVYANSGTIGASLVAGTLTTAAQPNITSTGTLTSLTVTNTATAGNLSTGGTLSATGNANVGNLGTGGLIVATGNVTGGNLTTGGALSVTGNANVGNIGAAAGVFTANVSGANLTTGGVLSVTGNANVGNLGTAGLITATGNVSGGNLTTSGVVSATGNVSGGNVNATSAVVASTLTSNVATGTAPFTVTSTTRVANLNVATAGVANTVNDAAQPNITSVGTLTSLTVTGNASAGNLSTGGALSVTGNANVGNLGSGGLIVATGNVTGGNLTTAGVLSVTGNANVGNLGTAGLIVATGNVTGGNLVTSGALSVTGNANAGNIGASAGVFTTVAGSLTTASQPNITSVGTLSSLAVTANVAAGNLTTGGILSVTGTGQSSIAGNLAMNTKWVTGLSDPVNAQDAATKIYVDTVAQGLHVHAPCAAATPTTLASITSGTITYNNGSSGVGATLTTTTSFTTIDGVNIASAGTRILVKNETTAANNGIYVYTNSTTLTRADDFNTPAEMAGGDFTFVTAGTLYNDTGWVLTDPVTTVGTTAVTFVQFSGAGTYTAGTGLTLSGTQFSITNTAVTAGSYGNGDAVATFTVNGQGQLTAASNVAITANAGNLSGTTLKSTVVTSSLTSVGTVTTGVWNNNIGSSATFAAGLSGANLASITGGNVTGQVGNALVSGTVYTAAQPNITSVGTLTSLAVTGNATAGNANVTGQLISTIATGTAPLVVTSTTQVANLNVATSGTAGTVTTAAQPNITSLGTLTGLGVNGTITAVNITANTGVFTGNANGLSSLQGTNVVGTLNSTTLGNSSLFVGTTSIALNRASASQSLTGITSIDGYAATVSTAAQPNITSVGTLTSLSSSGNITAPNVIANTGFFISSVGTGISAAGSSQGTGTALTKEINVVSTVASGAGVVLPTAVAGMRITIVNTSANALLVYPASGGAVNSLATNASFSEAAGARLDFVATSTTQWYTLNATYA